LLLDIRELEELLVQPVAAVLAVPLEAVELARPSLPLDYQAYGVSAALGGVRYSRG
jgi:hypothetical protein